MNCGKLLVSVPGQIHASTYLASLLTWHISNNLNVDSYIIPFDISIPRLDIIVRSRKRLQRPASAVQTAGIYHTIHIV